MPELAASYGIALFEDEVSTESGSDRVSADCEIPESYQVATAPGTDYMKPACVIVMQHGIYRVESFEVVGPHTLFVAFDDGTEQVINLEPVLGGELFGPLRELELFNQVSIDPEVHMLVWPNGSDFEPATLHDWPEIVDQLVAQAQQRDAVLA